MSYLAGQSSPAMPACSAGLEKFGMKFSHGGAHISRTMMLSELRLVLESVPAGSGTETYRSAILQDNVLAKTTGATRQKSLRHLHELYSLDEACPIFGLLRKLHFHDPSSLPLLAFQVAWVRDPLFRATTRPVLEAPDGSQVETASLVHSLHDAFSGQYSELNLHKIARNASSSWTQSGHLAGRVKKIRQRLAPGAAAVTMAFLLGHVAGHHGAAIFSNPWCRLLDLDPDRAKLLGREAHRAGLLNLKAVGEIVELEFPLFAGYLPHQP